MPTAAQPSYQPLPPPIDEERPRGTASRSRRKGVVAVGLVLGVVLAAGGFSAWYPRGQPLLVHHPHGIAPTEARPALASGPFAAELAAKPAYSTACWPFTGGTCNLKECYAWRNASCTWSTLQHYCMCREGMCTDAIGGCVGEQNKLVASGTKLKSAYYHQTLYIPNSFIKHALRTTGGSTGDQNFTFWEVPGKGADGMKRYMISSQGHPRSVLKWDKNNHGSSHLKVADKDPDILAIFPSDSFWVVCDKGEGKFQLGASAEIEQAGGHYVWAYTHRFSWMVYGWSAVWGEPDVRAEWVADPPLPFDLSPCP